MKFIEEYRDGRLAKAVRAAIAEKTRNGRFYKFMEFCGGHTHAIFRYGILDLLPANVEMVHGPGCPVCVLPVSRLDMAIELAMRSDVILCSYGDMLRVPGSQRRSLLKAKTEGADVRMVYSPADALALAQSNPDREVVFFAIGFETTTPPTAVVLQQAIDRGALNFSVLCNHVLTPPAIAAILEGANAEEAEYADIDGFLGPAHVSVVIGSRPFERFTEDYRKPVAIAGFEPLDVLQSILLLISQINEGRAEVENQYKRAVTHDGNRRAKQAVDNLFEQRGSFEWRGLGSIPYSALRIRDQYAEFDAEVKFGLEQGAFRENRQCKCPQVLRGVVKPPDCKLFGNVCTPENPIGSCMVSSEGACSAYYAYRRHHAARTVA